MSVDIPWLAEYLLALYKYIFIIGGAMAVLTIMIGGLLYSLGGANPTLAKRGKELALGSVTGLIILLASYLLLYAINPELVTPKSFDITEVKSGPIVLDDQPFTSWVSQGKSHGACWNQIVKPTKSAVDATLKSSCPFLGAKETGGCSTLIYSLFQQISSEIMADPRWPEFQKIVYSNAGPPGCSTGKAQRPWIYNWRCAASCSDCNPSTCISKSTGQWRPSPHSFAVAVDLDPCHNPACSRKADGTFDTECEKYNSGKPIPTTIPTWVINIFKKHNFIWGGDWKNYYDPMHFEWSGACGSGIVPSPTATELGCCTLPGTSLPDLTFDQCQAESDAAGAILNWNKGACS
jgi:hypothetical protein